MKRAIPFFIVLLLISCNSGGPSTTPSSSSPGASDDSVPADNPSREHEWTELMFIGRAHCSSELEPGDPWEGETGKYNPVNLYDDDPGTAWVEGAGGPGTGEYFVSDLGYMLPSKTEIRNGYQKSESIWKKNNRVRKARITLLAGYHLSGNVTEIAEGYTVRQIGDPVEVTLNDVMGLQEIPLPIAMKTAFQKRIIMTQDFKTDFRDRLEDMKGEMTPMRLHWLLKFEILEVFPGSDFDDTCISDIIFSDMVIDPLSNEEEIRKVYDSELQDMVLFDTDQRTGIVLADIKELKEYKEKTEGVKMAVTVMDTSPDREWAWIDLMSTAEGARVEEVSSLWYIRSLERINSDLLANGADILGFTETDGRIWLDTSEGPVDLELIRKAL